MKIVKYLKAKIIDDINQNLRNIEVHDKSITKNQNTINMAE